MRHLILLFLLLPSFLISQTEREQKLYIKHGTYSSPQNNEQSSKIVQRDNSYAYKQQTFNNNSFINRNPSYDHSRSRWAGWGAPYNYNNFIPFYYYDRFGLRHPGRIYNSGGKQDTVKGQKTHWRVGLSYNTDNQLGGWVTVGNKNFFMFEYCSYLDNDQSSFLPNITMDEAISWNDRRLDDIVIGGGVYAGGGIKFNSLGVYIMPGVGWDRSNFQFFDELFILSNNGKYSFPNYSDTYFTGKVGIIYDYKMLSTRMDYNPFRQYITFGLGLVF